MHSTWTSSAPAVGIAPRGPGVTRITARLLAPALVACALGGAGPTVAQEATPPGEDTLAVLESEPIVLSPAPTDSRRTELKRVLLRSDDSIEMIRERKRRSAEERNALKRELREALRGVYEQELQAQQ